MQFEKIHASDLTDDDVALWQSIQNANPHLMSPYFNVEFTQVLAKVRTDIFVIRLLSSQKLVGFFPCQIDSNNILRPIAGALSDNHGVVIAENVDFKLADMVTTLNFKRFTYDHFIGAQDYVLKNAAKPDISPIIDISEGYEHYLATLGKKKTKLLAKLRKSKRKLEADKCQLEFNLISHRATDIDFVIRLKEQQFVDTIRINPFEQQWITDLFQTLFSLTNEDFSGVLSTLSINGELAAAHFGMRNKSVWHWWFPVYDKKFQKYTPGLILLDEIVRALADTDTGYIDLGKDMVQYKRLFYNNEIPLVEGVEFNSGKFWQKLRANFHLGYIKNPQSLSSKIANKVLNFNNINNRFS